MVLCGNVVLTKYPSPRLTRLAELLTSSSAALPRLTSAQRHVRISCGDPSLKADALPVPGKSFTLLKELGVAVPGHTTWPPGGVQQATRPGTRAATPRSVLRPYVLYSRAAFYLKYKVMKCAVTLGKACHGTTRGFTLPS